MDEFINAIVSANVQMTVHWVGKIAKMNVEANNGV